MKVVHGPGPWTRSTEGVHGPGVHVLYFPPLRHLVEFGNPAVDSHVSCICHEDIY